jgi:hypothetical protein
VTSVSTILANLAAAYRASVEFVQGQHRVRAQIRTGILLAVLFVLGLAQKSLRVVIWK